MSDDQGLAEELGTFRPPAPGSRTAAAANAADQATPAGPADIPELPTAGVVPVAVQAAEECVPRTRSVQAGGYSLLLPQDPSRVRAVLLAVDSPMVLCRSVELAQDASNVVTNVPYPTGFYLPAGIPLEYKSKGALWVASTIAGGGAASRVSVLVEHANPGL